MMMNKATVGFFGLKSSSSAIDNYFFGLHPFRSASEVI